MSSDFRIGIVGCGKIARRHVEACLLSDNATITALVDPTLDRAESLAREFGVDAKILGKLDEALPELDGVVIAVPNNLHCRISTQCANAGVNVLIEKPIADNSQDAAKICDVHDAAGTVCAVGFVTRFARSNRQMHRLIDRGYFGAIEEFAYQFGSRGGWAPYSAYNLDRQATGGGVLVVTGSHFLDRMLHWFGDPVSSALWSDSLGGPEANAFAAFRFENASSHFVGTARFSKTVGLPAGIVLRTDKGIVSLVDSPDARIRFCPNDEDVTLTIEPEEPLSNVFQDQIKDFVAACRNRRDPIVTGRDALRSVLLTESLYENCLPLAEAPLSSQIASGLSYPSDGPMEVSQ